MKLGSKTSLSVKLRVKINCFFLIRSMSGCSLSKSLGAVFSSSYHQVAEFMPEAGGYSSLLYGKVVDMLYFPLISGYFPNWFPIWGGEYFMFFRPVFNIADTSISFGVGFIILFQKKYFAEPKKDETNSEKEEEQEKKEIEFTTPE